MKKSMLAAAVLAIAAVLTLPTAANAETYPGAVSANSGAAGAVISYSAPTGQPAGTSATVSLTGTNAAESGTITAASTLTKSIAVSAGGTLKFAIKLPATAPAGATYTLAVAAGAFADTQTLAVTTAATSSGLAFTGLDAAPYVWFGGGLVALGAAFFLVLAFVRRSRKTAVQA